MARPKTPLLSRNKIVAVALRILRKEGESALTLRRIARELNVNPNSIYNHFDDLDQIKDELVAKVIGRMKEPIRQRNDWRDYLVATALEYFHRISVVPNIIPLIAERRTLRFAVPAYERVVIMLTNAGFAPDIALILADEVESLAIGTAVLDSPDAISRSDRFSASSVLEKASVARDTWTAEERLAFSVRALADGMPRSRPETVLQNRKAKQRSRASV